MKTTKFLKLLSIFLTLSKSGSTHSCVCSNSNNPVSTHPTQSANGSSCDEKIILSPQTPHSSVAKLEEADPQENCRVSIELGNYCCSRGGYGQELAYYADNWHTSCEETNKTSFKRTFYKTLYRYDQNGQLWGVSMVPGLPLDSFDFVYKGPTVNPSIFLKLLKGMCIDMYDKDNNEVIDRKVTATIPMPEVLCFVFDVCFYTSDIIIREVEDVKIIAPEDTLEYYNARNSVKIPPHPMMLPESAQPIKGQIPCRLCLRKNNATYLDQYNGVLKIEENSSFGQDLSEKTVHINLIYFYGIRTAFTLVISELSDKTLRSSTYLIIKSRKEKGFKVLNMAGHCVAMYYRPYPLKTYYLLTKKPNYQEGRKFLTDSLLASELRTALYPDHLVRSEVQKNHQRFLEALERSFINQDPESGFTIVEKPRTVWEDLQTGVKYLRTGVGDLIKAAI